MRLKREGLLTEPRGIPQDESARTVQHQPSVFADDPASGPANEEQRGGRAGEAVNASVPIGVVPGDEFQELGHGSTVSAGTILDLQLNLLPGLDHLDDASRSCHQFKADFPFNEFCCLHELRKICFELMAT